MIKKARGFASGLFFGLSPSVFGNRVAVSLLRCDITNFDDVRLVFCCSWTSFMGDSLRNCVIVMGENEDVR